MEMDFEKIFEECDVVVENQMLESLHFYFTEYSSQRKEFAKNFKQAFCCLVDDVLSDLREEEEEE